MTPPNSFLHTLIVPFLIGVWIFSSYLVFRNNPGIMNPEPYIESLSRNRSYSGARIENEGLKATVFTGAAAEGKGTVAAEPARVSHRYVAKKENPPPPLALTSNDVEWILTESGYVVAKEKNRLAVSNESGDKKWEFALPAGSTFTRGEPAVANGAVYAATTNGRLYAFSLADGGVVWYSETTFKLLRGPKVSAHGLLLPAEEKPNQKWLLAVFDMQSGAVLKQLTGFELPLAGDLEVRENLLYYATQTGHVEAYDLIAGESHWSAETSTTIRSRPTILGERLYLTNEEGSLLAFDKNTGRKTAEIDLGAVVEEPLRVAAGTMYGVTVDTNGNLIAVDLKGLKRLWKYNLSFPGQKQYPLRTYRLETRSLNELSFASGLNGWTAWTICSGTRICIFDMREGRLLTRVDVEGKPIGRFEIGGNPAQLIVPVEKQGRFEIIRLVDRAHAGGSSPTNTGASTAPTATAPASETTDSN